MLYACIKILARFGLRLYFRKIIFSDTSCLTKKGPLLLACNHPNSLLDAIVLGAFFNSPIHFLARADVFTSGFARRALKALNAIPIYRMNEGSEHVYRNEETFAACVSVLRNSGIVLIFAEGICVNEWNLRPLKKGAARIALQAWQLKHLQQQFEVLPVGLNYSSFTHLSKALVVQFGLPIRHHHILSTGTMAEQILQFNRLLYHRLTGTTVTGTNTAAIAFCISNQPNWCNNETGRLGEIKNNVEVFSKPSLANDLDGLLADKYMLNKESATWRRFAILLLLAPVAAVGCLLHAPLYWPLRQWVARKTTGTVFYHSVLFALLLLLYPVYCLLIAITAILVFTSTKWVGLLVVLPLLAGATIRWWSLRTGWLNFRRAPHQLSSRLKEMSVAHS